MTVVEDVVLDQIVAPAVEEHADVHVREDVPEDRGVGSGKVQVDPAETTSTVPLRVVDIVVAYDRPHIRVVTARIDSADIPGFMREVIEVVVFDVVIVAVVLNAGERSIVDAVVGNDVAYALQADSAVEGLLDRTVPVDVIVDRKIAGRRECRTVPAIDPDAGPSDVIDIAPPHAVLPPAVDDHAGVVVDVADRAGRDQVVIAPADLDRTDAGALEVSDPEIAHGRRR